MHKKTILLVDDEEIVLESLGNYLEKNSFAVSTAISGEDALNQFKTFRFDLVITDLVMKGLNGMDVLKEIKQKYCDVGVFILTGYGKIESVIEAFQSGADDFILKPCDADELVHRIENSFEKQALGKKDRDREKFLSICMYCRKIKDNTGGGDEEDWLWVDEYLHHKYSIDISHGCCPECCQSSQKR